jgi:hypothetical protein
MNRGDVVLCKMYGKEYKALVWGENVSNDAHRGTNGEPSLHLLMVTEPLKPLPLGQQPEPTIVYDVLHESFAGIKTAEWCEATVIKQLRAADLDAAQAEPVSELHYSVSYVDELGNEQPCSPRAAWLNDMLQNAKRTGLVDDAGRVEDSTLQPEHDAPEQPVTEDTCGSGSERDGLVMQPAAQAEHDAPSESISEPITVTSQATEQGFVAWRLVVPAVDSDSETPKE